MLLLDPPEAARGGCAGALAAAPGCGGAACGGEGLEILPWCCPAVLGCWLHTGEADLKKGEAVILAGAVAGRAKEGGRMCTGLLLPCCCLAEGRWRGWGGGALDLEAYAAKAKEEERVRLLVEEIEELVIRDLL